ncbi:hypothetical protein BDV23DRAFT_169123 [Aspergillus alliaceus]|uniref:Zn(2)-C6 fungal-type domain-containing protein n=1 Tax=Petromyces alliaceus TaxID=209559 RepID=A0A5N7CMS7_PETAA|nr:hypothetical protein BDV23DRAFT_169123 [Aspergillus alliaceus]
MVLPEYAPLVCVNCKKRKKRCDKMLPSCSYCIRKGLDCRYVSQLPREPSPSYTVPLGKSADLECIHPITRSSFLLMDSVSSERPSDVITLGPLMDPTAIDTTLYLQARRIIQMTNQFVDDISVRYFQGIHRHLPVVSRKRFHDYLIYVGGPPPASFSALLLSICLVTYHPEILPRSLQHISRESLYLTIKLLFTQVQATFPPSVHLIQAGVLLALYEYARGKPDDAFLSITSCARMGYAAGLHHERPTVFHTFKEDEEAANTWSYIIILERLFSCDISARGQPFATDSFNHAPQILPEHNEYGDKLSHFLAAPVSIEMRGLGYSVRAAWLLDQVLTATKSSYLDIQLGQLDELDTSLRAFLEHLLPQCQGVWGVFCGGIGIAIRALFMLHWHILGQLTQPGSVKWEERKRRSNDTLDTVTNMVIDIAGSHVNMSPHLIDLLPPSCVYITRAALKHIHDNAALKYEKWLWETDKQLEILLDQFGHRWGFDTSSMKLAV